MNHNSFSLRTAYANTTIAVEVQSTGPYTQTACNGLPVYAVFSRSAESHESPPNGLRTGSSYCCISNSTTANHLPQDTTAARLDNRVVSVQLLWYVVHMYHIIHTRDMHV